MNRSTPWLRIGVVVAILAGGLLLFHYWGYGPMGGYRGYWPMFRGGHGDMMAYGGGWGMGYGIGGIGMLLVWVVIIIAVAWLVAGMLPRTHQTDQPADRSDDALEILRKRYARGEIDKAEFEAKRRDLSA